MVGRALVRQPCGGSRPNAESRQPNPHALVSDAHPARQIAPPTRRERRELPAQISGITSQAIQRVSNALSMPDDFSAKPRSELRAAPSGPRPLTKPKIFLMITERVALRQSLRRHGRQFNECGGLPIRTSTEAASRYCRPPHTTPEAFPHTAFKSSFTPDAPEIRRLTSFFSEPAREW